MKNKIKNRTVGIGLISLGLWLASNGAISQAKLAVNTPVKKNQIKHAPTLKLNGVLEGAEMTRVKIQFKQWRFSSTESGQKVLAIKHHGDKVKKGEILLRIDTKDIDLAILKRDRELQAKRFSLKKATLALKIRKQTAAMDLLNLERNQARAVEALAYYLKVEKVFRIRDIQRELEKAKFGYEYEKAELDQLMQMYQADDLTNVTEEMILKRQKRSVANAAYYLKKIKAKVARQLKRDVPEEERVKRESVIRSTLSIKKNKLAIQAQLSEMENKWLTQSAEFEKAKQAYEAMRQDREQLTIRSDRDGVVYYGDVRGGKFDAESYPEMLKIGGYGLANTVLMTVVSSGDFVMRVELNEEQKKKIKQGMIAQVTCKAYPKEKMKAQVLQLDHFEKRAGKFGAVLKIFRLPQAKVRVGMPCEVIFGK